MSTALRLIQDVRPATEPQFWSYYLDSSGKASENLSRDDITNALRAGQGTLWVDVDTRSPEQVACLSDVFHFHPLAIEEAVHADSRVKLEEYDNYLLLIVRTVA